MPMRLGLDLGYPTSAEASDANLLLASRAEELGFDIVWVAEAYGADAVSILGALAGRTERIGLGSGVMQIPGRTPALTAMTAATLDVLSHGLFHLGLGVSGPQVSEGWHGVPFAKPLGRTREYVDIVRAVLSRKRLVADGEHFTLPLPGGQGKPLVLALQPVRRSIPVYLAAVGPKNLDLAAEIADGWLGFFVDVSGGAGAEQVGRLRAGLAAHGREVSAFDVNVGLGASIDDDLERAADRARPHAALYIGGMGSKKTNFYHRIATGLGYGREADRVQELFLARDYAGAAAAVPTEFLDRVSLLGDQQRIAARLRAFAEVGVSTASIQPFADDEQGRGEVLATVAAAARDAGVVG
jgi:F420-dependent oxidoreductase-like protein